MRNPENRGYVTWDDVQHVLRWFELGYGVKLVVETKTACPPGEQFLHMYCVVSVRDENGAQLEIPRLPMVKFPGTQYRTLAGAWLSLLYKTDEVLHKHLIWTEPTFGRKPERGLAVAS